jgi:hypothetical protein
MAFEPRRGKCVGDAATFDQDGAACLLDLAQALIGNRLHGQ